MKRRLLFFGYIIVLFISLGCEDNSDLVCDTVDPVAELDWISEYTALVDESCSAVIISLFQATYKRKTVFYIQITDPRVNTLFDAELLDCEGDLLRKFESDEQDEFYDKVKDRHVVYSCPSNAI